MGNPVWGLIQSEKTEMPTIYQNIEGGGGDASHDPGDEIVVEAQMDEEHLDVELANTVKSLGQINL